MNGWVGVMPVLNIAMDGWMGGCNASFKDCYLVKKKQNSQQQQRKMYHQILYKGKKKTLGG